MSLFILCHRTSENEQSPEFRYLLSVQLSLARQVFGQVRLAAWRRGCAEPQPGAGDYVLLLGRDNVWLTANTLQQMKTAIDAGCAWALPACLDDMSLQAREPLFTARDFELLEREIAVTAEATTAPAVSHLPVSLMSRHAFDQLAMNTPLSELVVTPIQVDHAPGTVAQAGVLLRFADYYGEARSDLLPYLPDAAEDVLEIGCGRGMTGRLIQARLGCRVTGVELHPEAAAEAAQHLSRVIVGDVDSVTVDGRYDAIVASELLEHVADADGLLSRLRTLLKPGGRIVLSVPNVGHYSIVEDLLAGRWDYVPVGLLCYTHLRFFTRQTLADWGARLGFECAIEPQLTDLPERFLAIPPTFQPDLASLRTKGFYVVLRPLPDEAAQ